MDIAAALDDLRNQTNDIFGSMESAEAEIRAAMRRQPEHSDLLFGTFLALRPFFPFCSDMLYRVHCRELLERVPLNMDLREPTRAEYMELLQRCTAFIPFHSHAGALYRRIFEEAFPGKYTEATEGVETLNERFEGETDPLRREIRAELYKITANREPSRIDTRWRGYEAEVIEPEPLVQMELL